MIQSASSQTRVALSLALATVLLVHTVPAVFAVTAPTFPNCPNPGGSLRVSYSSGVHGIPGKIERFEGSDHVYTIDEDQVVQCYCAPNGSGIQTNWWKVGSLDQDQISMLEKMGWIYIPNGELWGLDSSAYFAQNIAISCTSSSTTTNGSSSSSSSSNSSSSTNTVLATVLPAILGFADTGRQLLRTVVGIGGIVAILAGLCLFFFGLQKRESTQ